MTVPYENRKEYFKKYREEHRERMSEYVKAYQRRKRERALALFNEVHQKYCDSQDLNYSSGLT